MSILTNRLITQFGDLIAPQTSYLFEFLGSFLPVMFYSVTAAGAFLGLVTILIMFVNLEQNSRRDPNDDSDPKDPRGRAHRLAQLDKERRMVEEMERATKAAHERFKKKPPR